MCVCTGYTTHPAHIATYYGHTDTPVAAHQASLSGVNMYAQHPQQSIPVGSTALPMHYASNSMHDDIDDTFPWEKIL